MCVCVCLCGDVYVCGDVCVLLTDFAIDQGVGFGQVQKIECPDLHSVNKNNTHPLFLHTRAHTHTHTHTHENKQEGESGPSASSSLPKKMLLDVFVWVFIYDFKWRYGPFQRNEPIISK